jgi:hypothetical protein
VALLAGCRCARSGPVAGGDAGAIPSGGPSAPSLALAAPRELAPGITVERVRGSFAPAARAGDGRITIVRIDPARYEPRLFTAARHGARRTAPAWAADFSLAAVTNASMYAPDGRSVSLMIDDEQAAQERDDARFGGLLGFGPRDGAPGAVTFAGRDCAGFDLGLLRRGYRSLLANYRLLDCAGAPIPWKDDKVYSAAAIGLDRRGWVVLMHTRTPYAMRDFATMIAAPELGVTAAHYVEGGPEASLYVHASGGEVREVGSYETSFREDDDNKAFWELPNVIGFVARP